MILIDLTGVLITDYNNQRQVSFDAWLLFPENHVHYIMHLLLKITTGNNIYTKLLLEILQSSQSGLPLVLCIKSIQLILCDMDILHKVGQSHLKSSEEIQWSTKKA